MGLVSHGKQLYWVSTGFGLMHRIHTKLALYSYLSSIVLGLQLRCANIEDMCLYPPCTMLCLVPVGGMRGPGRCRVRSRSC